MSELTMRDTTATLATARLKAQPRRGIPGWLRWGSWVPTLITFVIAALLWQIVAWTNPYVLPTLEAIGASLVEDAGMYWSNFLVTLLEVVVGASAGILAGFLLAVVMAEFQIIERAVMPLVIIVMVTPIVAIAPALVAGNAVVVIASEAFPLSSISFAEVLATSDVPAGVVNVLTGSPAEMAPWLASHDDVNALDLVGAGALDWISLQQSAAGTLKRVLTPEDGADAAVPSLQRITAFTETKTVWHTKSMI